MHVAVFGAGALGAVYGVRLAALAGATVSFVVRATRASEARPIIIERVRKHARMSLDAPVRVDRVPEDADVVVLAVHTGDLDALAAPLAGSDAPIVVLTPMMPRDYARMRATFGKRVLSAMPGVISYARKEDGVVRYWLPPQ